MTTVDEVWAEELASKANVDSQHLLFLDSLETVSLANFVCGSNKSVQPLQLHVVMSDSIVSSYFNCYTTGNLRSLQWKFENINHNLVDGDCVFSDSSLSTLLRDLVKTRKGDIMLVIFSSMFKKQSEHLVKVAAGRSTGFTLYLINIDAYYANILNK